MRGAVRRVLGDAAADGTWQIYDVAHNVAKPERHGGRDVLVHRKGATRAFPPGHDELPEAHRAVGQAVFIPGSMGTPRSCRRAARARWSGRSGPRATAPGGRSAAPAPASAPTAGITVRSASDRGLAEEAPFAYKDVEHVVDVVERAGLAVRVAQLRPVGVVKGRSRYAPATPPGRGDPAGDTRGEFT